MQNQATFHKLRTVGLLFLVFASVSRWFLHPTPSMGRGLVDGIIGLLYGIAIGCLILSLRAKRSQGAACGS